MSEGRVITFYSYKGGVGRTQALASVGTLLSRWGHKVLCVDWDLEAPGLDRYFHRWLPKSRQQGVVELIQAHVEGKNPRWQDHVVELEVGSTRLPLSLMPAGVFDGTYKRRIQNLDWAKLYEAHDLGAFLERLRDEWKESYDFILVDSRTGITDIGGICTIQLPDQLVLLFTANHQGLEGVIDVWRSALAGRNDFAFDRGRLLALPVATRFEHRVEYERAQVWLNTFVKELEPIYAEWVSKDVSIQELLSFTRIPSVPYWSFGEELPVLEEEGKDPEQISFAFETLAALLANRLSGTDMLVRNRESYVSAAWKSKPPEPAAGAEAAAQKPVRVFLSYASQDSGLVSQFKTHLAVLGRQGLITSWHDRYISPGTLWEKELDVHIEEADIILLFLSAEFLASGYVEGRELRRALQRQQQEPSVRVIPVLLRPVHWKGTPFARIPMFPWDVRPITSHENVEELWAELAGQVGRMAREIHTPSEALHQKGGRRGAATFKKLHSLLDSLPEVAADAGFPTKMAFKDVGVGPEDSKRLELPRNELLSIAHGCSVSFRGFGGGPFPSIWQPSVKHHILEEGMRVVDTRPSPTQKGRYTLWEVRNSGHFAHREGLVEDFIIPSPDFETPKDQLSVEWALKDIVKPLRFARNIMGVVDYPGRWAVKYRWSGLKNRSLTWLSRSRVGFGPLRYVSEQPVWEFESIITPDSDLYDAAYKAAQSLFLQFGWEQAMSASVPGDLRTLLEGRLPS